MAVDTSKYADLFLAESREHMAQIDAALLELERGCDPTEPVTTMFRAAHTIKGMAAAMGYSGVSQIAHDLETTLDRVGKGGQSLSSPAIDALFQGFDVLAAAIEAAVTGSPAGSGNDSGGQSGDAPEPESGRRTVRVDATRLDSLMNLVGELVIARGRLAALAEQIGDGALDEAVNQASRLVSDLHEEIVRSRMVPVWQVFDRFPRLVRDTARSLGKEVELKVEGKEIELDRSMLDEIGSPLTHLIRNAIDHGVELPEERERLGKARAGRILLKAERERAAVAITVSDDGRGIDRSRVLARANALGLPAPAARELSNEELIRLLSKPGFSTADRVTDVSGRGVGIDAVDAKVRSLGGSIDIESEPGRGTTLVLRLPLTLAIMRALTVQVEGETYAIPLVHVVETVDARAVSISGPGERESMLHREQSLPLLRLRSITGLPASGTRPGQVVIVDCAGRRAGILVDECVGQQEITVKQYDAIKGSAVCFSGATILGDGAPALILDVCSVV
jgi:two-component system, chemotaxis family, sensor kinase CheA